MVRRTGAVGTIAATSHGKGALDLNRSNSTYCPAGVFFNFECRLFSYLGIRQRLQSITCLYFVRSKLALSTTIRNPQRRSLPFSTKAGNSDRYSPLPTNSKRTKMIMIIVITL